MPPDPTLPNPPQITDEHGPLGGPTYVFRGVVIDQDAQGTTFRVRWPNMDLDDWKGATDLEQTCKLIDAWLARNHPI